MKENIGGGHGVDTMLTITNEAPHPSCFEPRMFLEAPESFDPVTATIISGDLEQMHLDLIAMTTLLRSLSFALIVQRVESALREKDAGPPTVPMSPEDWKPYA